MNHPKNSFGLFKLEKPVKKLPYFFGFFNKGVAGYAGIKLSQNTQKLMGVLNCYIRLEPVFPWTDNTGVFNFLMIVKKIKSFVNLWKRRQKKLVHLRDYNETPDSKITKDNKSGFSWLGVFVDILRNIKSVSHYLLYRLFSNKDLFIQTVRLRNFMEMEPVPENRIILSEKIDVNGQNLSKVIMSTSELDRKSLIKLHKVFKEHMEKNGLGKLEGDLEQENLWPITSDASHHLGGTRMGDDPKISVVNSDLCVHGVHNLYICGGSVFPTSGCANPTYTICALSVRLADKLKNYLIS